MKTYCTFGNGTIFNWMFQVVKNLPSSAGIAFDVGSTPGLRRSPGVGNISPLQYSCLENYMERGALQATVHSITKSWTGVNTHACTMFNYKVLQ